MDVIASKGGTSASYSKEKFRGFAKIINGTKSSTMMRARRSVIRVHPGNTRDSVILDAESANSVSKISYFCQQIVYQLKESIMKETAEEEDAALRKSMRIFKKYGYCYTRDFKKDGLTKPKILIEIIHEELQKKYPDVDFDCFRCLIHQSVELDTDIPGLGKKGDCLSPKRGHSLGMGNELTTLIQVIISRMVQKVLIVDKKISVDTWNDDFRCHGDLEDLKAYRVIDLKIIKDLDYPLSSEKTRILDGATVFLEEYSFTEEDVNYSKHNRAVCNLVNILFARNIVEAKTYSRAIYESMEDLFISNPKVSEFYMNIIGLWGYEFHKAEFILPERFGGWYTCKYMFLNETFNLRSFEEVDPKILVKLARAEEVDVSLKYKRTYAFNKYSDRHLEDKRPLTEIERVFAPHGDILLSNFKSIAGQTEKGLTRSRLADLFFDVLAKERNKVYKSNIPEISRSDIMKSIISKDVFTSYAIPKAYCMLTNQFTEDETYNALKFRSTGIVEDMKIEWKYLDNQELTILEKCRLISRSRLIKSPGGVLYMTILPDKKVIDRKVLKYYPDYRFSFLYYREEYGAIPSKIYLDLPDKFDALKLTEQEFDLFTELQDNYPTFLDLESSKNLDRFIQHYNMEFHDIIELFKSLKRMEEVRDGNERLRIVIKHTLEVDNLIELLVTEPKEEYSVNDIDMDELENIEIIQLDYDEFLDEESIVDENALASEEIEFVYEYHDTGPWDPEDSDAEYEEDDIYCL